MNAWPDGEAGTVFPPVRLYFNLRSFPFFLPILFVFPHLHRYWENTKLPKHRRKVVESGRRRADKRRRRMCGEDDQTWQPRADAETRYRTYALLQTEKNITGGRGGGGISTIKEAFPRPSPSNLLPPSSAPCCSGSYSSSVFLPCLFDCCFFSFLLIETACHPATAPHIRTS